MKSFLRTTLCLLVLCHSAVTTDSSAASDDAAGGAASASSSTTKNKIDVELGAVQETMLIPLIGRAMITKQYPNGDGLIYDEKSVEIVDKLDYDFSNWEATTSVYGAVLRTRILDQDVQMFRAQFGGGGRSLLRQDPPISQSRG